MRGRRRRSSGAPMQTPAVGRRTRAASKRISSGASAESSAQDHSFGSTQKLAKNRNDQDLAQYPDIATSNQQMVLDLTQGQRSKDQNHQHDCNKDQDRSSPDEAWQLRRAREEQEALDMQLAEQLEAEMLANAKSNKSKPDRRITRDFSKKGLLKLTETVGEKSAAAKTGIVAAFQPSTTEKATTTSEPAQPPTSSGSTSALLTKPSTPQLPMAKESPPSNVVQLPPSPSTVPASSTIVLSPSPCTTQQLQTSPTTKPPGAELAQVTPTTRGTTPKAMVQSGAPKGPGVGSSMGMEKGSTSGVQPGILSSPQNESVPLSVSPTQHIQYKGDRPKRISKPREFFTYEHSVPSSVSVAGTPPRKPARRRSSATDDTDYANVKKASSVPEVTAANHIVAPNIDLASGAKLSEFIDDNVEVRKKSGRGRKRILKKEDDVDEQSPNKVQRENSSLDSTKIPRQRRKRQAKSREEDVISKDNPKVAKSKLQSEEAVGQKNNGVPEPTKLKRKRGRPRKNPAPVLDGSQEPLKSQSYKKKAQESPPKKSHVESSGSAEASRESEPTDEKTLEEVAQKLEEDPLMRGKPPCEPKMHSRRPRNLKTCTNNPNCLFGLGEDSGVWTGACNSAKILGRDPRVKERTSLKEPVGLINLGATCYVNALIQTLYMIPHFRHLMYEWTPSDDDDAHAAPIKELRLVFGLMQKGNAKTQDLRKLVSLLELDSSYQQDAQEFHKLLLGLLDSVASKHPKENVNRLGELFRGGMHNIVKCLRCKKESLRPEDSQEIQINIKGHPSLRSAFEAYAAVETLEGHDKYACDLCKSKQDAERYVRVSKLPEVLIVLLNRFVWDLKQGVKRKVKDSIEISDTLDFANDDVLNNMLSESLRETIIKSPDRKDDFHYSLTAVLAHKGAGADAGHYTADVLDVSKEPPVWYTMDDEKVSIINKRLTSSRNAYMLVYRKTNSLKTNSKDLDAMSKDVQDAVNSANDDLTKEIESFDENVKALDGKVAQRRKLYEELFIERKEGTPFAGEEGKGVWVPTDWLQAWISGNSTNLSSSTAKDQKDDKSSQSSSSNGLRDNDAKVIVDLAEDTAPCNKDSDDTVDLSGDDPNETAGTKSENGDNASADGFVVFTEPPNVQPFLCQEHVRDGDTSVSIGPGGASRMKRLSIPVWKQLAASCGLDPEKARLPYAIYESEHPKLACPGCFKVLRQRVKLIQESTEVRQRIEVILRKNRQYPLQTNEEDRIRCFFIARTWVNHWLHYNAFKDQQADAVLKQVFNDKGNSKAKGKLNGTLSRGKPRKLPTGQGQEILADLAGQNDGAGSEVPEPSWNINESITCEHNNLTLGKKDKWLLYPDDWKFIFHNALGGHCFSKTVEFLGTCEPCSICSASVNATKNELVELAARKSKQLNHSAHKSALNQLLRTSNKGWPIVKREGILPVGVYYVLPRSWLVKWRLFISNKANTDEPMPLSQILQSPAAACAEHQRPIVHHRLLYWLRRENSHEARTPLSPEEVENPNIQSSQTEVITEAQWDGLVSFYGDDFVVPHKLILNRDLDVSQNFFIEDVNPSSHFEFQPALCVECMGKKMESARQESIEFDDKFIHVLVLPESKEIPVQSRAGSNGDYIDTNVTDSVVPVANASHGNVRRTRRKTDQGKRASLSVCSSMSLGKVLALAYYDEKLTPTLSQVSPSSIKIYCKGRQLDDLSLSLAESAIHAGDEVYLKIMNDTLPEDFDPDITQQAWFSLLDDSTTQDTSTSANDKSNRVKERGFQGSLLSRANI